MSTAIQDLLDFCERIKTANSGAPIPVVVTPAYLEHPDREIRDLVARMVADGRAVVAEIVRPAVEPSFSPELGQAIFGNPTGEYEAPEYVVSLVDRLLYEVGRVYGNRFQRDWDSSMPDPDIPGLSVRSYWWGADDAPEAALPNFAFEGVEVRWYKHPGRSVSLNVQRSPAEWVAWFDACLAAIRACDVEDCW